MTKKEGLAMTFLHVVARLTKLAEAMPV